MSDERLRLIAEFKDAASSGVRRLKGELGEVRETPGMTKAAQWMKGFELNAKGMQVAGGQASAAMGAIGIGGLAAAGGIASAVKAMKEFGEQKIAMQSVARETGLAIDQIEILKRAARDMHVDPKAMVAGIQHFSGEMEQARRGLGALYGELNQQAPAFAKKLKEDDPASAVKDYLDWLSRIPEAQMKLGKSQADGIQLQKRWASLAFGTDDVEKLVEQGPGKLAEAFAKAAQETPKTTAEMVAGAEALSKAAHDFDDAIDRFQTGAGPFIFRQLKEGIEDFTEAFKAVEGAVQWFQKNKDHPADAAGKAIADATDAQAEANRKNPPPGMIVNGPGLLSDAIHAFKGEESLTGDRLAYQKRYIGGEGVFAAPKDADEARKRLDAYRAERAALEGKGDIPSVARAEELDLAVKRMSRAADELSQALKKPADASEVSYPKTRPWPQVESGAETLVPAIA